MLPDPYYWWEAGTVFNALIEYSKLTGDSQYDSLISEGILHQIGEQKNFMPTNATTQLGNEDQSTWALAAMTAAEMEFPKPKDAEWVDYAVEVFNNQVERQEIEAENATVCGGGGLRWQIFPFNNGYSYKDAKSNGNFFLLASRLAKFTGNQTYSDWAEKSYNWAKEIGLINEEYQVYDGTSMTSNCTQMDQLLWTYPNGIYTEGAATMANLVSIVYTISHSSRF